MYGGFGRSSSPGTGARGGQGFGFRGSSPPWPYVGRGRGGLPRCACYTGTSGASGTVPASQTVSREEELNYLKNRARAVQDEMERINIRIQYLESEKGGN